MSRFLARVSPLLVALALLAVPASADVYYVTLTNGTVVETARQPQQASWDPNMVLLLTVELICLPIFGLFYNVNWTSQFGMLFLVLLLATWGLTVVGTMFSALTVNMRLRELMLPTLVYPTMIPALLGAIQLTTLLAVGEPITPDYYAWLRLLVGFDVIYTLLGLALVDTVLVG